MQPLVSVIIPAYNAEKCLARTLESVFSQSYSNLEVIVINDGSTDKTSYILDEIAKEEPRLKVINQTNHGIAIARNNGIEFASGEFITFIDSDDHWESSFITKLVLKQQETSANIVYTGKVDSSENGDYPKINDFREINNLVGFLSLKSLMHLGCLLIKRQFLDKNNIRFDASLKTGEDIVFICHLFCLSTAFAVPEYLYYYVYRNESIMNRPWSKTDYLTDLQAWQRLEKIIQTTYVSEDKETAITLVGSRIVYYKLRLLWILLLKGRYQEVSELLNDNFLFYEDKHLKHLPKKYAGIRRKIIESNNKLLWKLTKLIHKDKSNLI